VRISLIAAVALTAAPAGWADTTATYTYDALGRVSQVLHTDGSRVVYQYDLANNRTQAAKIPAGAAIAPVANAIAVTTASGTAATVNPLSSDSDPNGLRLSLTSINTPTAPAHGTATFSGSSITYTPASGYSGADSFSYTITNTANISSTGLINMTVQAAASPPSCKTQVIKITGVASTVTVTETVTAAQITNLCTDAAGYSLTVTSPSVPDSFTVAYGALVVVNYTVSDGHGNTASSTITYNRPSTN